jgi:hypothetical protein
LGLLHALVAWKEASAVDVGIHTDPNDPLHSTYVRVRVFNDKSDEMNGDGLKVEFILGWHDVFGRSYPLMRPLHANYFFWNFRTLKILAVVAVFMPENGLRLNKNPSKLPFSEVFRVDVPEAPNPEIFAGTNFSYYAVV